MKKIVKNICLVFIFVFCMFFINTNDVKADGCACYYRSGSIGDDTTYTVYYYKINFTEKSADIDTGKYVAYGLGGTGDTDNQLQPFGQAVTRGEPFKINSKEIVKNACTIEACQKANVRIKKKDDTATILWEKLIACDDNCSKDTTVCGGVCNAKEKSVWQAGYILTAVGSDDYEEMTYTPGGAPNSIPSESDNSSGVTIGDIKNWGTNSATNSLYGNNSLNACSVISDDLKDLLNKALSFISVAGVLILIIMSMIEFVKAITGANDDLIKTALKHTIIRIVCAIILFLLPMLVTAVIDVVNDLNVPITDENGNVVIGEDGNPLCGVGNKQK